LRPARSTPPEPVRADAVPSADVPPLRTATSEARAPIADAVVDADKPIIDAIEIEKPSVCAGEENLIRVRAHTAGGSDAYLRTMVAGQSGAAVPLRLEDDGRANHDWPRVLVSGRNGAVTVADVPRYEVRNCTEKRHIAIAVRAETNAPGQYRFEATPPASALRLSSRWRSGWSCSRPGPFATT